MLRRVQLCSVCTLLASLSVPTRVRVVHHRAWGKCLRHVAMHIGYAVYAQDDSQSHKTQSLFTVGYCWPHIVHGKLATWMSAAVIILAVYRQRLWNVLAMSCASVQYAYPYAPPWQQLTQHPSVCAVS